MGCEESYCMKTLPGHGGRAKAGSLLKNQPRKKKTKSPQSQNNLEESSYCLTEQDNYLIQTALLNHSLLFKARGYANREIINRLESFKAGMGQVIFQKGDPSHYFYIIVKGSVRISDWAEGQPCKILKRGDCFGDLGIYNKTTRSATATALQDCEFVGLQSQNFLRISLDLSKRAQNDVFKEIKSVTIFKNLSTYQKHKLSFLAQELKFKKDAVVFKKGEASSCLYVIKQGRVRLSVPGKDPIEIKAKQSFGQSCLNGNNPERIADAICLQSTILLAFSRADIEKYLDRELFDLQTINKLIWAFKHNKNLRVSQIVLESMIQNRELHYFTNNEIIAQKGDPITHLVVSLEGGINNGLELEVLNTDYLIDIKHHTKDLRKTGGSGDVAFISIEDLQKTFHRSFNSLIDLNQNIWKQIQSISKIQEYVKTLSPNEFYVVQNKGNSDIGCTLKIKTESNIQFALRIFDKSKTIRQKDEQLVVNLGDLANKLYHNLIAKQYRVYSDKCRVYIMSKWVEGEDLFDLLAKTKKLSVIVVKHFAACVINIMQYLHHRRIIWRQLKIQSFVVDTSGYLNLVDLMYLQQLPEEQSFLSNTRKATFYYLAPEILSNQGYGFQTDFWSLGVLLYRMLVGQFPYGATISTCQDSILEQLLEQIKTKPLYLPSWLTSDVKMLLKLLLNPSPLERGLISFSKLKNSTIFKDYDWLGLIERKVKNVPYTPKKVVQKLPDPIRFHYWLQNVQSELPPSSILDQLEPKPKTAKK